jgi:hypothetical protein
MFKIKLYNKMQRNNNNNDLIEVNKPKDHRDHPTSIVCSNSHTKERQTSIITDKSRSS